MLLLATLLWVISITNVHEGKDVPSAPPGMQPPPEEQFFSTYVQCMKEMDKTIADLERAGLLKRLSKYETESLSAFPYDMKFTQRWECKESKEKKEG
jgi:hypothetical protein